MVALPARLVGAVGVRAGQFLAADTVLVLAGREGFEEETEEAVDDADAAQDEEAVLPRERGQHRLGLRNYLFCAGVDCTSVNINFAPTFTR